MRDVTYLPGTEDREPVKQDQELAVDFLISHAADHGWDVSRRGTNYAQLTRKVGPLTEQISLSVVGGQLKASVVIVVAETDVSDQVVEWIETKR
jgi:hypothetical protein